jgi:4'-phosphopantetheinyl transferase
MRATARHRGSATVSGVHLRWGRPEFTRSRRANALDLLSNDELRRWNATALPEFRDRFLLGRLLLREMTAELLGLPIERVIVSSECPRCGEPHGRPIIGGVDEGALHASLSSTRDLVVAALLPARSGSAVGVDVEATEGAPDRLAAIDDVVPREGWSKPRRGAALRRWTRVEAVLKADGRALRVDPRRVALRRAGARLVASVGDDPTTYDVFDRRIGRQATLSVAVARSPAQWVDAAGSIGSASA